MNIDKVGRRGMEAYTPETRAAAERTVAPSGRDMTKTEQDKVSISQAARDLQEAQRAVQSAPEVRAGRVAELKEQIQEGTYQVPEEAVIEKLLPLFKGK